MLSSAVHTRAIKGVMYGETQTGGAERLMADRLGKCCYEGHPLLPAGGGEERFAILLERIRRRRRRRERNERRERRTGRSNGYGVIIGD